MNKFYAFCLVSTTLLLQGCAVQVGYDNSFTAQAARDVKSAMAVDLCPWGAQQQDIDVRSRVDISKDYNSQYRDNSVQKYEEHSGRNRTQCLPKPGTVTKKK